MHRYCGGLAPLPRCRCSSSSSPLTPTRLSSTRLSVPFAACSTCTPLNRAYAAYPGSLSLAKGCRSTINPIAWNIEIMWAARREPESLSGSGTRSSTHSSLRGPASRSAALSIGTCGEQWCRCRVGPQRAANSRWLRAMRAAFSPARLLPPSLWTTTAAGWTVTE